MKRLCLALMIALGLRSPALAQKADLGTAPSHWRAEFPLTDFDRSNVHFSEILSVIGRDQILAVQTVTFLSGSDETRLDPREPVLTVQMEGAAPRAYPIRYLMFHEIANDVVAGVPIAVTYCPLCNSGMVFDRRVQGQVLSFGVSGKLRNSDMVMYDLETESFWQQAVGEGIVGQFAGAQLTQIPAWMESWAEFTARAPDGLVMDAPLQTAYGRNPYVGYDSQDRPYATFYTGDNPPHGIPALMRVVRVGDRAWTLARLQQTTPLTEAGVTITWTEGQASAMDTSQISEGREVGSIRVRDAKTSADLPHDVLFAFAFHAFWPDGQWMLGTAR